MTATQAVFAIIALVGLATVVALQLLILRQSRAQSALLRRRPAAAKRAAGGSKGPQPLRKADLRDVSAKIRQEVDRQHRRTVLEVEALVDLRALVSPRTTMPSTQGWAASPMTTSVLVREVLDSKPELVVEAGSGGSSVWVGYCLEQIGSGRCVSLDHEEGYAEITRAELRRHGLEDRVEVRVCPLVEQQVGGDTFRWYDLSGMDDLDGIDIVFVDGPPGTTGPLARYPALPLLKQHCKPGARFLLDDAWRKNETAIVERWTSEHGAISSPVTQHVDACKLLVLPGAATGSTPDL